jgi:hypothetical protein
LPIGRTGAVLYGSVEFLRRCRNPAVRLRRQRAPSCTFADQVGPSGCGAPGGAGVSSGPWCSTNRSRFSRRNPTDPVRDRGPRRRRRRRDRPSQVSVEAARRRRRDRGRRQGRAEGNAKAWTAQETSAWSSLFNFNVTAEASELAALVNCPAPGALARVPAAVAPVITTPSQTDGIRGGYLQWHQALENSYARSGLSAGRPHIGRPQCRSLI